MIAQHFEPGCAKAGMDDNDLTEFAWRDLFSMVEGCAFEERTSPKARELPQQ